MEKGEVVKEHDLSKVIPLSKSVFFRVSVSTPPSPVYLSFPMSKMMANSTQCFLNDLQPVLMTMKAVMVWFRQVRVKGGFFNKPGSSPVKWEQYVLPHRWDKTT